MEHIGRWIKNSFAGSLSSRVITPVIVMLLVMLLVGAMPCDTVHATARHVSERSTSLPAATKPGDAERGRALFNGKGICLFCHGRDGDTNQLPALSSDTTKLIDRLNPRPSNLRDPRALKLTTDRERFKIVREGHPGTAMLPDKQLTDEEIFDLLAYLAKLRGE